MLTKVLMEGQKQAVNDSSACSGVGECTLAALACGTHLSVAPGVQQLVAAVTLEAELVPVFAQ